MSPRGQQQMSFGVPPLTRGVKWLGIVTLAVSVLIKFTGQSQLEETLTFFPALLWRGHVWQIFTYSFLHLSPFDLVFALLGLWFVGGGLEQRWGTRRFIAFYFMTAALGAIATGLVGLVSHSVATFGYQGNWAALEGMIAAFAVMMPDATFFLYVMPVQARWMLPISAVITVVFMLMGAWYAYLPQLFGLGAGVLLSGGYRPGNVLLRFRVWWIDRRLRKSKLRVVRGEDEPFGGSGRGSDKYLH